MQESYFITVSCLTVFREVSAVPLLFRFPIFFCGTLPKNRPHLSFYLTSGKILIPEVKHLAKTYFCIALLGFLNVFLSIRIKNSVQRHTLVRTYVFIESLFVSDPCVCISDNNFSGNSINLLIINTRLSFRLLLSRVLACTICN